MKRTATAISLCLAALGLTACNEHGGVASNPKVCVDFKQTKSAPLIAGTDGVGPVDECVKRWAYSLAGSRDTAGTVADAAVAACNVQLARWNQQTLNQPGSDMEAASLITGRPTTPLSEHSAFTAGRALFYVVQARAGRCAPPPIVNGLPEGVS
ncbi:hypothetical protein [Phenylobacterium sp.]|uniref:hypothetical protein n=1 Tax=Phenylobacterium sp. TaxID=1871053 RepID=UPI00286D61F5|nr:hypothetical protein [Phenylobacterium sp.]